MLHPTELHCSCPTHSEAASTAIRPVIICVISGSVFSEHSSDSAVLSFPSTGYCSTCVFLAAAKPHAGDTASLVQGQLLEADPKVTSARSLPGWPSVSIHVIFCESKCFSSQRKPLKVKQQNNWDTPRKCSIVICQGSCAGRCLGFHHCTCSLLPVWSGSLLPIDVTVPKLAAN